ncbi:MAG TPA: FCD domain-containing protein [Actinocrinis sp.]|nr:FCD domain-containing protein [Actinocrinis sp.]
MANTAGKFGPYPAPARGAAGGGAVPARFPVRAQTGAERIRSRIALDVRLARLSPGDRLPDAGAIAEDLVMSEMTVRRALETMCQDGLLDRRRGRAGGTFVAAEWDTVAAAFEDAGQAAALGEFHLLLECGLVARSTGELPAGWDAELRAVAAEMDEADDTSALPRLEARFHLGLAETLGEGVAGEQVADLLGHLCLLAPAPPAAVLRDANQRHLELLAALELGRLDAAVAALKAHQVTRGGGL